MARVLSPEELEQVEKEVQEDGDNMLSLNAICGNYGSKCIRIRAMLLLVDAWSYINFISKEMVEKLGLKTEECSPMVVKVASREMLRSDSQVKELMWWARGHTFVTTMRVLDLGVFDGFFGIDWLESYSPMQCDWVHKTLSFEHQEKCIQLQGDCAKMQEVSSV